MTPRDHDPALRRFEQDAVIACFATAVLAFAATAVAQGFGPAVNVALGVLGGGLLIGLSYRAIKGGVDVLVQAAAASGAEPEGTRGDRPALSSARKALLVVKFFTRYALLAVGAYVMLTCFRLHPVGLLAGATSPFLAALMQVGRLSRAGARRRHR